MYEIRFYRKAKEYLSKISPEERKFILKEIYKLKQNPYSHSRLKPLKGYKKLWKLYIKENRAIIKIIIIKRIALVLTIGHRRDVYGKFFDKGKK